LVEMFASATATNLWWSTLLGDVLDDNMTIHVILGPFSLNDIVLKCTNKLGRVEQTSSGSIDICIFFWMRIKLLCSRYATGE
jgi:hypothetical protein